MNLLVLQQFVLSVKPLAAGGAVEDLAVFVPGGVSEEVVQPGE